MSKLSTQDIQYIVSKTIPPGVVLPRHDENGHFYEVELSKEQSVAHAPKMMGKNPIYESVTGKLKSIKDESIMTFMMNEALRYVRGNYQTFTEANIDTHLTTARQASADIRDDAGDLGTEVHNARERFFSDWIAGRATKPALDYLESDMGIHDSRAVSCLRGLEKFIKDYRYEPIITELLVYSHKLKTAGTLDDIGWLYLKVREGDPNCEHDLIGIGCAKCDLKYKKVLALVDLKTSNQIKHHYAYQVALYYEMFRKLTGIKIDKFYILKLSKIDGTYQLQEIKRMGKIVSFAKNVLKMDEGNKMIKESFKKPAFKLE